MEQFLVGVATSSVFNAMVPEAVYPFLTFGVAVAAGTYAIWSAPRTKELEILIRSHSFQLESWEQRLKHDEQIIDDLHSRLEECKKQCSAANIELMESHERLRHMQRELDSYKGKQSECS